MRIFQVVPQLNYGDAVGNDAIAVCNVIDEMGYETAIYAEKVDDRLKSPLYRNFSKLPKLNKDDILIFNHCCGTELCYKISKLGGRKMMIYHNITPPKFFLPYSNEIFEDISQGYKQTKYLSDKIEYVMAVSEYNATDLRNMGYNCPMYVRPILIPFEDYAKEPDKSIIEQYSDDGYTNIVFVGRIAPNKKQEDIIKAFAYYKKHVNPKSRLILVGNASGMERYDEALKKYVEALMLEDVIFTGHISFKAILAYYRIADVFLCMSEHEGFCVPLVEAMYFDVPIIAYDSSAIADTLGGSGVLIKDKDPVFVSLLIDRLVNDSQLRKEIIEGQQKRLEYYSYEKVREILVNGLNAFIDGSYNK